MVNKGNVPYYMAGTLATFTLLASGVFAAAPYIGFLAPVAALSIGLPFIIGCAVLSAVAIALSAVAISKNNTISQQKKFESRVAKRKQEEENARARLKAKGLLPDAIVLPYRNLEVRIAERKQEEESALKDEGLLSRVIPLPYESIEASSPENQPAKEGNGQSWGAWALQNKSKVGAVAVAGVAWLAYVAANGGLGVAGNSSSAVGNSVNSAGNDTLNLSSTCPNPTMQHPYELQCKPDENVIKLANDNDTLSLNLSSTRPKLTMQRPYKNVEASSPENQPAKEGNGQSWGAWALQSKSEIVGVVAAGGWLAWSAYVATNVGRNFW
ncbi:MAG: hypothetical protein ACEY3B_05670 [Wolbachia sp.]